MDSADIESSVQPADKINAPERQPIPRFSATSEIEYEMKNHPILEELAKKYNTVPLLKILLSQKLKREICSFRSSTSQTESKPTMVQNSSLTYNQIPGS